ncbi:MAG: hypothetical protein MNPFHGCM_02411 [Gemmatimonadaceae bacterium]|nr:hypothetical protein [Gemmatimonadaceae bacterium]
MTDKPWSLRHHPLLRLVLYYLALTAVTSLLWIALPAAWEAVLRTALGPLLGASFDGVQSQSDILTTPQPAITGLPPAYVALMTLVAGVSAFALSLPVSWVYMFARQKKGYSQSVVQSLVLMPVVIAVVAALVRNSIALAFSLAGIISAVRFRTTLDDSKDAVFMFVVTALGLACGVQLEVAGVLSVLFVVITLGLWFTDFARTPPDLEGTMADRRLARAMAVANRTSQFVARLDHEIIESMAPAQLDALSRRIDKRKKDLSDDESSEANGPRFDGRIKVTVSDPDIAIAVVEGIFQAQLKRWQQIRVDRREGNADLVYAIRVKKGRDMALVRDQVIAEGSPHVVSAEVGAWL